MASSVIAIDGPAASGKSTMARMLAERLNIPYINTGSLYRAIAWKALNLGIPCKDAPRIADMLATTNVRYAVPPEGGNPDIEIDGTFPGALLRTQEVAQGASDVATLPLVRQFTLDIQRDAAKRQLVVMEGRDIGTAIFPDAAHKFFLTASPEARAKRRLSQGGETPDGATVASVAAEIAERDRQDSERSVAPLKQADDAMLIDNSDLSIEETLQLLLKHVKGCQS